MSYQKLSKVIKTAIPDKRLVKLNADQIQALRTAAAAALTIIGVLGVATVAMVAPNLLKAIDAIFIKKPGRGRPSFEERQAKVARTFYYLKRHGLIRMETTGSDFKIFLTSLGKKRLPQITLNSVTIPKPAKWEQKWWQVAADIPTKEHRQGADLLRKKLKELGFYPLQRTLWFYPFDPRKEIEFICQTYGIEHFVTVMEINRLDKDDEDVLKGHFKVRGLL